MQCERCKSTMDPDEERDWYGRLVCEDCYMDLLSPARPCDPWAAKAAKSATQLSDGEANVTESQQRILDILEQGSLPIEALAEKAGMKMPELERDLAALHHMEMIGAKLREGQKQFQLWASGDGNDGGV